MRYCVNCGVELDDRIELCPLCQTPLPRAAGPGERRGGQAIDVLDPEDRDKLTEIEGQTLVWELLSVSLGIGAIVVLAIDLFLDSPGLGWSPYPLASIGLAWILLSAIVQRRIALGRRLARAAFAVPVFLLVLDLVDGKLGWSLSIALPICLTAELAAGILAFAISRSRRRGANIVAAALATIAAFCVTLEAILDLAIAGRVAIRWSAIVLCSLLPVSAFLLYLHYRVLGTSRLRRFFHL